jgi:hypothetical protein
MRNYQVLDVAQVADKNILRLSHDEDKPENPSLSMSREGAFVSISISFGPLEIALRLRHNELTRHLSRLHPVPGLATTRQTGGANAYISLGLTQDDKLVLRPTLVTDASGHIVFNLVCTPDVKQKIFDWLEVE